MLHTIFLFFSIRIFLFRQLDHHRVHNFSLFSFVWNIFKTFKSSHVQHVVGELMFLILHSLFMNCFFLADDDACGFVYQIKWCHVIRNQCECEWNLASKFPRQMIWWAFGRFTVPTSQHTAGDCSGDDGGQAIRMTQCVLSMVCSTTFIRIFTPYQLHYAWICNNSSQWTRRDYYCYDYYRWSTSLQKIEREREGERIILSTTFTLSVKRYSEIIKLWHDGTQPPFVDIVELARDVCIVSNALALLLVTMCALAMDWTHTQIDWINKVRLLRRYGYGC